MLSHSFSSPWQSSSKLALLIWLTEKVCFRTAFPRHGKIQASLFLLIWLTEKVCFRTAFPRHGKIQASLILLIWLTEKVCFRTAFPRHGIIQASLILLIWLTEKVHFRALFVFAPRVALCQIRVGKWRCCDDKGRRFELDILSGSEWA